MCFFAVACWTSLLVLTASADFSARLWDAVTGNEVHEFVHKHIVKSVDFAADRSKLATAGHEGILRIYDVGSPGSPPTEVSVGFDGEVDAFDYKHDAALLLVMLLLLVQSVCPAATARTATLPLPHAVADAPEGYCCYCCCYNAVFADIAAAINNAAARVLPLLLLLSYCCCR